MNVKSKALVVFMKFMKTHVFIQCIRNVIIHIDILLSDSEDLDINICFPNISLKFEDNLFTENGQYMFEKQPDAILFNNAQIVNAGLHDSIRKLRPRYLLTIRTENFNFGKKLNLFSPTRNAKYHQTASSLNNCANLTKPILCSHAL